MGLQIQVLNAGTSREIDAAFATFVRERADALFVASEIVFTSRRVRPATLIASLRARSLPIFPCKPPIKYELVINLKTAKALGLEVPPTLLTRADEVIE
jgi:putative ABC transport system substrate-binding protein